MIPELGNFALGLTIDFFAEERAREYQRGLADAIPSQRGS